jgi:hypothetical protein
MPAWSKKQACKADHRQTVTLHGTQRQRRAALTSPNTNAMDLVESTKHYQRIGIPTFTCLPAPFIIKNPQQESRFTRLNYP